MAEPLLRSFQRTALGRCEESLRRCAVWLHDGNVPAMTGEHGDAADWARQLAEDLLSPLSDRWRHTREVAAQAKAVAHLVPVDERRLLVAAAWSHDLGYAPSIALTGFHALDGARHLQALGANRRLVALVAHHSCARFEAQERGLREVLDEYPREEGPLPDALVYADMTTGPRGQRVEFGERLAEILDRYSEDDPVHRAITKARPCLVGAVRRTEERLRALAPHPM